MDLALNHGAPAHVKDVNDSTPLMLASRWGHVDVVVMLLHHLPDGEGLDEQDRDGKTALHLAARSGHAEVVKVLLIAGADSTIPDFWRTPRERVRQWHHVECLAVFQVRR